ncbi:MAG: 50S ribosomal protein L15 [Fimbriimonadaceae bacterium]|nr:50S ribosomal protein L15 [Fimbriimonadaceae bacterium]
MRLDDLRPNDGSKKERKRIGRGRSTGWGKTSGRGQKGQGSRAGGNVRPGFEGGQTPLHMRTPKLRGPFSRRSRGIERFRKDYAEVNVGALARFDAGTTVDLTLCVALGLCRAAADGLRVLGTGELGVALTIVAQHVSAAAQQKIEAAGGTVQLTGGSSDSE